MTVVRRLALLLTVEGAGLVVLGIGYGAASLSDAGGRTPAELAAGAGVATGLLLLLLARATASGRTWARGPAVTLNIFPLPVALYVFQAGLWWVGVPLVLLAGSVLVLAAGSAQSASRPTLS